MADLDAALVVQRLLRLGAADDPDDADDALTLFGSRLEPDAVRDGRGVAFLCGEFERLGEEDLLEQATAALLGWPIRCPASAWPPLRSAWPGCRWAGRSNQCWRTWPR